MKNPGIKDVAEKAGVSVTTVSRVLNNRGYISKEMYQKVHQAIEEIDFHPNQIARSLTKQRTNTVGFLLPYVSYPFFAQLSEKIEMALYNKGYKMLLCNTIGTRNRERDHLKMLKEHKVDGLILGNHELDFEDYLKVSFPIVALDIKLGEDIPVITSNHKRGGALAAQKFIDNGCKKVVQIKGTGKVNTFTKLRHEELETVLESNGVKCITVFHSREDISFRSDEHLQIIEDVFREHEDVDGFFAVDVIATKVLKYALIHGIEVPEKLKIISYDGTMLIDLMYPQLTCIKQSYDDITNSLVDTLDKMIRGEKGIEMYTECPIELIEGNTTY